MYENSNKSIGSEESQTFIYLYVQMLIQDHEYYYVNSINALNREAAIEKAMQKEGLKDVGKIIAVLTIPQAQQLLDETFITSPICRRWGYHTKDNRMVALNSTMDHSGIHHRFTFLEMVNVLTFVQEEIDDLQAGRPAEQLAVRTEIESWQLGKKLKSGWLRAGAKKIKEQGDS